MPPDPTEGGAKDGSSTSGVSGVDESLYSRQLYVMGHEAQVRPDSSIMQVRACVKAIKTPMTI